MIREKHTAKKIKNMSNVEFYGSVFLGDDHSKAFWVHNHKALRDFKPDFLLLEVIGKHRYLNSEERKAAKSTEIYIDDHKLPGYNSDAFKLADELDIPMIGIDTWNKPYVYNDGFTAEEILNDPKKLDESNRIREERMVSVAKRYMGKGRVLLIVGAEHLRPDSELAKYAKDNAKIKFFKL